MHPGADQRRPRPRHAGTVGPRKGQGPREGARRVARVGQKAEDLARNTKQRQDECDQARSYLKGIEAGGRFVTFDAKGERVFMEQDQIDAAKAKGRQNVEEACKGL